MSKHLAITIGIDILLLAELFLVMFLAQGKGEEMTLFFLKTFPPLAILTLLLGRRLKKRLKDDLSS